MSRECGSILPMDDSTWVARQLESSIWSEAWYGCGSLKQLVNGLLFSILLPIIIGFSNKTRGVQMGLHRDSNEIEHHQQRDSD